jgi:hypothetical protein
MLFGSFPKLMVLLGVVFLVIAVPLMSFWVTIHERRKSRSRTGEPRRKAGVGGRES